MNVGSTAILKLLILYILIFDAPVARAGTPSQDGGERQNSCPTELQRERPARKNLQTAGRPSVDLNVSCGSQLGLFGAPPISHQAVSTELREGFAGAKKNGGDERDFDLNSLIRDIAWPIVVLFLAFSFKSSITQLLSRVLKFKYKDTEWEFIGRAANESLAKIAHGGYLGTLNIDAVFESVKLNDWATLVLARMLMRKGLADTVGKDHEFGPSPSLEKLLDRCRRDNLLPADQIDDLERLREITFFAEWWNGRRPTKGDWKWALENCKPVIEKLFENEPVA